MRTARSRRLAVALLAALLLPVASDQALDPACNATVSHASTITDPVSGDDAFFRQVNPGSNIMLVIDNSGSMAALPACDPTGGGSAFGSATCPIPSITAPAAPASSALPTVAVNGTCQPVTQGASYTTGTVPAPTTAAMGNLLFMESVTPQVAFADQGYGGVQATDDLYDCPPWGAGPGCTTTCLSGGNKTDNCLYDPDAYYRASAVINGNHTSAARLTITSGNPVAGTNSAIVPVFDTNYTVKPIPQYPAVTMTASSPLLDLGTVARNCMSDKGFFIFNAQYPTTKSSTGLYTSYQSTGTVVLLRGTFLNGYPPKFMAARKVVKQLLWMTQDTAIGPFDTVRFGLSWFASNTAGGLISPLVPGKSAIDAVYSKATYRHARLPMFQHLNDTTHDYAGAGATPVGKTLLSVGQYFSQQTATSVTSYFALASSANPAKVNWTTGTNQCGGNCTNSGFTPLAGVENCAVCYPSCQKNSVIIVTDGSPNETETKSNFPNDVLTNSAIATLYSKYCPSTCNAAGVVGAGSSTCCPDTSSNAAAVPRVAAWLNMYNLWPTLSSSSPVTLTTYAVGFNVTGGARNTLNAVSWMGGAGDNAKNVTNATDLANAVVELVTKASMTETSFSAPAVDTLQTNQTSTSDAFLTRFIPNSTNLWEGHVFQASLFDEFGNSCDPTKTVGAQTLVPCLSAPGPVNPDLDLAVDPATGKAVCNRVFLVDQNCVPIGENTAKGGFYELDSSGAVTNVPAVLPWDAGQVLSDRSFAGKGHRSAYEADNSANALTPWAKPRNIFTWLPVGGTMTKVAFTTANVATLKPYLSIEPRWCDQLLSAISYSPLPADKLTECAKQIIYFVRGYDVFNAGLTGCRGPGHPLNGTACQVGGIDYGTERNRAADKRATPMFWKLGDIFHSTPVAAHMPASVLTCDLGYDGQCLTTIHSPPSLPQQTQIKSNYSDGAGGTVDAWGRYRLDNASRARVVMVGANDGMLHGFDAGVPTGTANALGTYSYTDGTGEELWAFIPPDLLPKLSRLTKNGSMDDHQYMVDGPTMVRDVWVDGSNQSDGTLGSKNGIKENTEFHTLAVLSERTGGNAYTALDVTNPANPKPLWTFPQPGSPEAKQMGYSWTDFSGRPPPIGPVRLAFKTAAEALAQDPTPTRGFEERWVVMINGGYDPTLVRGRAVFMLDAWTGQVLWRVTDDDLKTGGMNSLGFGSGTSMSSVPASVALMDVGDTSKPAFDADGFFDTATWGDVGGNLWVARFQEIGQFGASGRVENWFAARAFEQGRVSGDAQNARTRQPFFAMTSNAYEATTRTLRTFLGSGNREQLTSQGATCGQDNLIGCCQSGCQVTSTVTENLGGACGWSSTFTCDASGNMTHAAVSDSPSACATPSSCASASTAFTASTSVTISSCPGAAAATTASGAISCDSTGTCTTAYSTPAFSQLGRGIVTFAGTTPPPPRFFGVWAYGKDSTKMFSTLAGAQAFDQSRFTDSATYTGTCTSAASSCKLIDTTATTVTYNPVVTGSFTVTGSQATGNDPGWFYQYQGGNEKTGAGAAVVLGCTAWNGFVASGVSGANSCSGSTGTLLSRSYLSNFVTGVPSPSCGYADGTSLINRFTSQTTTAPPTTSNVRVVVNASGKVEYSALQLAPGSGPSTKAVGTRTQVLEPVYWMEVPRDLHNCRHDPLRSVSTCK